MNKSAKERFEKLGWSYRYIKGNCSEDTIQCKDMTRTMLLTPQEDLSHMSPNIQFNLLSKLIVINDIRFINMELIKAINQQCKELEWLDNEITVCDEYESEVEDVKD